jgi:CheY-like chemotaxis protein
MRSVLIVEDHKETAEALAEYLRFVFPEWSLDRTSTGKEAIERSLAKPPDVMVLDIALADDINGLTVIKRLWEGGLRLRPRIIVTTALGNRAFRGPRAGRPWIEQLTEQERTMVSAFFEKPYSWHALLVAVCEAVGLKPPEKVKLIPKNE